MPPGCTLFSARSRLEIDNVHVAQNAHIHLYHDVSSQPLKKTTDTLTLVWDEAGKTQVVGRPMPTRPASHESQFSLHVIPNSQRVFVVDSGTRQSIWSVDFATGETWEDPSVQPTWATAGAAI